MNPVFRIAFLSGLLFPVAAFAGNAESARDWLARMSRAAHSLNYEGTFIYEHMGRLQSMRVIHSTDGAGERERLMTLDGASREVIRDKDKVTCILPDDKAVMVDDAGRADALPLGKYAHLLEQLDRNYVANVEGSERVADRTARKIVLAPRDDYRYGQNVWLDEATGLLLKSEMIDDRGEVVERLMFTSLKIHDGALPESLLEPRQAGKDREAFVHPKVEQEPASAQTRPDQRWRVARLPPGFREIVRRHHVIPSVGEPVEHLVFSDGVVSVSVFIQTERDESGFTGSSRKGAVNVYSRLFGDYQVTVLGEVPNATVRLIGDSVTH